MAHSSEGSDSVLAIRDSLIRYCGASRTKSRRPTPNSPEIGRMIPKLWRYGRSSGAGCRAVGARQRVACPVSHTQCRIPGVACPVQTEKFLYIKA